MRGQLKRSATTSSGRPRSRSRPGSRPRSSGPRGRPGPLVDARRAGDGYGRRLRAASPAVAPPRAAPERPAGGADRRRRLTPGSRRPCQRSEDGSRFAPWWNPRRARSRSSSPTSRARRGSSSSSAMRYGAVLADHQRLLREAFDAHRGYEVDTQGDSFFVAFASARDALLAAVEGQRALVSHDWPEGVQIQVRMGLHTGQAVAARRALHGPRGPPGCADRGSRARRPDPRLAGDADAARGRGGGSPRPPARPRRAAPQGPRPPGAALPGGRRGAAGDLPARPGRRARPPTPREAAIAPPFWRRRAVLALAAALALRRSGARGVPSFARASSDGGLGGDPAEPRRRDRPADEQDRRRGAGRDPARARSRQARARSGSATCEDRTLTKIDPAAALRDRDSSTLENRTPTGIAVGLGAVWVAHGVRGDVSRVDPQFGQVTDVTSAGGAAFGSPYGSVAVGAGSVWSVFADSTLARLDAAGKRPRTRTLAGIAAGGHRCRGRLCLGDELR